MIYAMFAMVVLTFVVAGYLFKLRYTAVKAGVVSLGSFRLNNGTDTPPQMVQAAKNFSNLFEVPVLFYAAGTLALTLHLDSASVILLGWIFVASRVVHSWIHLTNNNVIHRMQAFMFGNVCVLLMWTLMIINYSLR